MSIIRVNGSERIQDPAEKLKRMQELAGIKKETVAESTTKTASLNETVLHEVAASNGNTYGIVAEGAKVYIKKLVEGKYQYMTGLENKLENKYDTFAEGLKHLNVMLKEINVETGTAHGTEVLKKK